METYRLCSTKGPPPSASVYLRTSVAKVCHIRETRGCAFVRNGQDKMSEGRRTTLGNRCAFGRNRQQQGARRHVCVRAHVLLRVLGRARRARYFAYSVERVSRTTVTLICPGYCISSSMRFAMSRARIWHATSSTSVGLTITRI